MSSQSCGCDPEAHYVCDRHISELTHADRRYYTPCDSFPIEKDYPGNAEARKTYPVASGVLDYFPLAIMEVAHVSWAGNQQHYPADAPLHWDRSKSSDEADALLRHFIQRGTKDTDGIRHSAKVAWRDLALLQKELEQEGNRSAYRLPAPFA